MAAKKLSKASPEVTETILSFVELVGWAGVVGGGWMIVNGLNGLNGQEFNQINPLAVAGLAPGAVIAFLGLIDVAVARVGAVHVQNAQVSREALSALRDMSSDLAAMRDASASTSAPANTVEKNAKGTGTGSSSSATTGAARGSSSGRNVLDFDQHGIGWYRGRKITRRNGVFITDGISFETIDGAKRHIDGKMPA